MPNCPHIKDRVILKTKSGEIVVLPQAEDIVMLNDRLAVQLTDAGKEAWNKGEQISWYSGHYDLAMDISGLKNMDFG